MPLTPIKYKNRAEKIALGYLLAFLMLLAANLANAACTTVTFSSLFGFPSASMPARDAPLITPLTDWRRMYLPIATGCDTRTKTYFYLSGSTANLTVVGYYFDPTDGVNYPVIGPPTPSTYSFGAEGVGYIAGAGLSDASITPYTVNQQTPITDFIPSSPTVYMVFKVRMVRYAKITSAYLRLGGLTWGFVQSSYTSLFNQPLSTTGFGAGTQTLAIANYNNSATCAVNNSNLQVNLPSLMAKQLSTVGATAGGTPFTVSLNCPTPVNVYMTVTDNSNPGQTSNIIGAASGSTATGVGVQVSQNGIPVSMGPDSSTAGNTNQFLVGGNQSGTVNLPFTASYIRTATVGAGSLKAVATFTMSYQ